MKAKRILEVLGLIDEKYIQQAALGKGMRHILLRWGAIAACLVLVAVACFALPQRDRPYRVLQVGVSDCVLVGNHTANEYPLWESETLLSHEDPSAPREATVSFNGITYTGSYDSSHVDIVFANNFVSHRYEAKTEEGKTIRFSIHSKTHELTEIQLGSQDQTEEVLTADECREIADAIADDYLSLKAYKVYKDTLSNGYAFLYFREVSGYITEDSLRIVVDQYGNVTSCNKSMLGSFANVKRIEYDEEKTQAVIDAKLEQIFGDNMAAMEFSVTRSRWVKTADGDVARLLDINCEHKTLGGGIIQLMVIL